MALAAPVLPGFAAELGATLHNVIAGNWATTTGRPIAVNHIMSSRSEFSGRSG